MVRILPAIVRLSAEVFPASRLELAADSGPTHQDYLFASRDVPDSRNRDSGNARRNTFAGLSCEKQLVVFSAMQGKLSIDFSRGLAHTGAWNKLWLDFRSHAAFFANVRQIS